jgi:hypothetical protein
MYEVVDYYSQQGVLAPVDGDGSIEKVAAALLHAIEREAARWPGETAPTGAGTGSASRNGKRAPTPASDSATKRPAKPLRPTRAGRARS